MLTAAVLIAISMIGGYSLLFASHWPGELPVNIPYDPRRTILMIEDEESRKEASRLYALILMMLLLVFWALLAVVLTVNDAVRWMSNPAANEAMPPLLWLVTSEVANETMWALGALLAAALFIGISEAVRRRLLKQVDKNLVGSLRAVYRVLLHISAGLLCALLALAVLWTAITKLPHLP